MTCSCGLKVEPNVCDQGRGCPLRQLHGEAPGLSARLPRLVALYVVVVLGTIGSLSLLARYWQ